MNRRDFAYSLAAASLGSMMSVSNEDITVKKALRLTIGDKVGLIAPAGQVSEERITKAHSRLQDYGLSVKEGRFIRAKYGYLAGTDAQRLEDFHEMYKDESVKAIWCIRGGYGCTRLLDRIDFKLIKKNPKILIGFSDITALLNAIFQKTGLIGFHGPVASSNDNPYTRKILRELIMFPRDGVSITPYIDEHSTYEAFTTLKGGKASGRAVGGNLSLLSAMTGTLYEIDFEDRIVFIEDVGEEPYRLDRMLTQLLCSGKLKKAKGIALGQFRGCDPDDPERSLSLMQVFADRLGDIACPVASGFNFGHIDHNFTFPIGGQVRLDFDSGKVDFLEKMVL